MYSLVDYIEIPEEYQTLPQIYLDGICKACISMIEPLMPYKTGYLLSQLGYDLQTDQVVVYIRDCDYAVYLEEDIAKTAGFWDAALAVFETAFYAALENDFDSLQAAYEEASMMIKGQQYGLVYKSKLAVGMVEDINMGYVGG